MPAKSLSPDADVASSPKETITQVYVCKFPSCSRSYVSTDGAPRARGCSKTAGLLRAGPGARGGGGGGRASVKRGRGARPARTAGSARGRAEETAGEGLTRAAGAPHPSRPVARAGVRKHCRKHHPAWLAALDEQAKEGRTHNRSELYCVARPLTREEAETFAREEPRKRQRTAPEEVNRGASDETAVDSPLLSTADVPQHAYSTPQHGPAAESPRGEYVFAEHQPWAIAVQMPPLRLEDPLLAHHDSPVTFNFNEAMPPPKRGARPVTRAPAPST